MSNPSLVWAQLSMPNPAAGSVPFVDVDNATIITDVLNYSYSGGIQPVNYTGSQVAYQQTITNGLRVGFGSSVGTPGNATINKIAGRIKIAAGQVAATITNNCCFATSIIQPRLEGSIDATATRVQVTTQANGSFIVTLNAAATADVTINFFIVNVF